MRRDQRRRESLNRNKNIYYLVGGTLLLFIIVFIVGYLMFGASHSKKSDVIDTDKFGQTQSNVIIEEASTSIGKTVDESKNQVNNTTEKIAVNTSNMKNTTKNTTSKNTNTKATNTKTTNNTKTQTTSAKEAKDEGFIRPVSGDILKEYAKDNLIFSQTLNEWVTHTGIDLRAEKTEVVKASAAGTVKTIKNDPRYGLTITIEHEGGIRTVYANLLTSEFVVEGEKVKQGQTIGTVGNTAVFESSDDTHLHFEILKDNVNVDPMTYLK